MNEVIPNNNIEGFINKKKDNVIEDPKKFFVYGSLMEGLFNYKKVLKGKVISRNIGRVQGLLYHQDIKGYPAIVNSDGWVVGELLEFKKFYKVIIKCDKIEKYYGINHPNNEYERRICKVVLENGEISLAWIYWYVRNDLNTCENPVTSVLSGNWRNFLQSVK